MPDHDIEAYRDSSSGLYRERACLIAALARKYYSHWNTDLQAPNWKVICIHLPSFDKVQNFKSYTTVTWHISPDDLDIFPSDLSTYTVSDYDGHTTDEKYRRLREYG